MANDHFHRVTTSKAASHIGSFLQGAQAALSQGQPQQAAQLCRRALAADARNPDARYLLGLAHAVAGETDAAIGQWQQVLQVRPGDFATLLNLGAAYRQGGRLDEAVSSFVLALGIDETCTDAILALSQVLELQGRTTESVRLLANAVQINPDVVQLHRALGVGQHRAGQLRAALAAYDRVLALQPGNMDAWLDRGRALESLQELGAGLASYRKAVALSPSHADALAGMVSCSVRICDWPLAASSLRRLRETSTGVQALHPFLALSVSDEPAEQLRIAQARARRSPPGETGLPAPQKGVRRERVQVAYVSSDLRDHPVAYVLAGVLEKHDRDRFEIHAVSLQPEASESEIGRRLFEAVEHRHDVSTGTDAAVAQALRELRIDIAVDLNGYTIGGRPGIFAHRAAPVQVNYLGYAGTSGAPYMDYLLADEVVIPSGDERYYSERIVRLPHCYLPNDDRREIGPSPTRAQAGLPESGLVMCAFTNAYKINPPVFDVWMKLLREVPRSVLWLRSMGSEAQENLLREAQSRGVQGERLIFAPHVKSMAEHLGRHRLADLYLDTLPYNAHSTACDALWSGVPVLTCAGRSFASRVAASALTAVGLSELITHSLGEYESRAQELAQQPQRLQELRSRLEQQRLSAPLFDTARFCRSLEAAYLEML